MCKKDLRLETINSILGHHLSFSNKALVLVTAGSQFSSNLTFQKEHLSLFNK